MGGRHGWSREDLSLHALNAPSAGAAFEEEEEVFRWGRWGMSPGKGGRQETEVAVGI